MSDDKEKRDIGDDDDDDDDDVVNDSTDNDSETDVIEEGHAFPIVSIGKDERNPSIDEGNDPTGRRQECENPSNGPKSGRSGTATEEEECEINDEDESDDTTKITVSVVTWNLAEGSPSEEEASFIRRFRKPHRSQGSQHFGSDIVLIAGQETEDIKPRRAEGRRSRELRRIMIKMLGREYVPVAIHSLGGVQLGVCVRRAILNEVESVRVTDVACGIGNVFHNKGAIGAFIQMKARSGPINIDSSKPRSKSVKLLFVAAHMAAHVKNIEARNEDFWRIASEIESQAHPRFLPPRRGANELNAAEGSGGTYLLDSMDHIFFAGDLNYRIDLPREMTEHTLLQLTKAVNNHAEEDADKIRLSLLRHDQLCRVIAEGRAFPGFAEGKITFAPTFKFDKGTKSYDTSHKQRIPAWTDRILFKPFGVRVLEYQSEADAVHSDHRPVWGTFLVDIGGKEIEGRKTKKKKNRKRSGRKAEDR